MGTIFYDMTHLFSAYNDISDDLGPAVAVDRSGRIYATFPGGVAIIDANGELLATIPFASETKDGKGESTGVIIPNSITFGHDGYLYVTSQDALIRMRVKSLPIDSPTNLIVPLRKKTHTHT